MSPRPGFDGPGSVGVLLPLRGSGLVPARVQPAQGIVVFSPVFVGAAYLLCFHKV